MVASLRRTSHPFGPVSFTMSSLTAVAVVFLCFAFCTQHTAGWTAEVCSGCGSGGGDCGGGGGGEGGSGGGGGGGGGGECGGGGGGDGQRAVEDMVRYLQGKRRDLDDRWGWAPARAPPLMRVVPPAEEPQPRLAQHERLLRMLEYDFSPLVEDFLLSNARRLAVAAAKAPAAPRPLLPTPRVFPAAGTRAEAANFPPPTEGRADTASVNAKLELENVVKRAIEKSDSSHMTAWTTQSNNVTANGRVHGGDVTMQETVQMLKEILARTTAKAFANSDDQQTTEQVPRGITNKTLTLKPLGEKHSRRARFTAEMIKKVLKRAEKKLNVAKKRSLVAVKGKPNTPSTTPHVTLTSDVKYQHTISKPTTNINSKGNATKDKLLPNNSNSKIVTVLTKNADSTIHENLIKRTNQGKKSQYLKNTMSTENTVKIELPKEIHPRIEDKVTLDKQFTKRNIKFLKTGYYTNMEDEVKRRDRDIAMKKITAMLSKVSEKAIGNVSDFAHNETEETSLKSNLAQFGEVPFAGGVFIRASIIEPRQIEFETEMDADRPDNDVETMEVDDVLNIPDPNPRMSMVQSFEFESPFMKGFGNQYRDPSKVSDDQFLNTIPKKEMHSDRDLLRNTKTVDIPDWNAEFPLIEKTLKDVVQRDIEDNLSSAQHFQRILIENKRRNESKSKLKNERSPSTRDDADKRDVILLPPLKKQKRVANITGFVNSDVRESPRKTENSQNPDKNILLEVTKGENVSMPAQAQNNNTDIDAATKRNDLRRLAINDAYWRNPNKDSVRKLKKNSIFNFPIHTEESNLPRVQLTLDDIHIDNVLSGVKANSGEIPVKSGNLTKIDNGTKINDYHIPEKVGADPRPHTTQTEQHEKESKAVKDTMLKENNSFFKAIEMSSKVEANVPSQDVVTLKNVEVTSSPTDGTTDADMNEVSGNHFPNAIKTESTNDTSTTKNKLYENNQLLNLDTKKTYTMGKQLKGTTHGRDLPNSEMTEVDSSQLLNDDLKQTIPNIDKRDVPDMNTKKLKQISVKSPEETIMSSLYSKTNDMIATADNKQVDSQNEEKVIEAETTLPEKELNEGAAPKTTQNGDDLKSAATAIGGEGSGGSGNDEREQESITMSERANKSVPEKEAPSLEAAVAVDAAPRTGSNYTAGAGAGTQASALHCYQCRSDNSPNCGSKLPDKAFLKPCFFEIPQPISPVCRVVKHMLTEDRENDLVVRSCEHQRDPRATDSRCFTIASGKLITCDCQMDGCNGGVEEGSYAPIHAVSFIRQDGPVLHAAPATIASRSVYRDEPLANPELRSSACRLESPTIYIMAIVVPLVTFPRSSLSA